MSNTMPVVSYRWRPKGQSDLAMTSPISRQKYQFDNERRQVGKTAKSKATMVLSIDHLVSATAT